MKKKIFAIAAIAVLAFSFGGCTNTTTKISSEIGMANPWEDVDSLSAAEEKIGFEMEVPEDAFDEVSSYRVCAGLNEIEVQYEDGSYIRKAKDDGDISGDYSEYKYTQDVTVGENTVTLKGDSEDEISLAIWISGDYSYAVGAGEAVDTQTMSSIVEGVN